MTVLAILCLAASFLSIWIRRDPKIWGTLALFSCLFGMIGGNILFSGALFLLILLLHWVCYYKTLSLALFAMIIAITGAIKLKLLPGYNRLQLTTNFWIGLEAPLTGLLPLALFIPVATKRRDWKKVLYGTGVGIVGILLLSLLASFSGVVTWKPSLIPFIGVRLVVNLLLTAIPEEAFFRGFIQERLYKLVGKTGALILTSLLFTAAHIYWSPDLATLGFVFLASLLYGFVYIVSKKIESAIITHFLLNVFHMLFFSYHAI